MELIIIMVVLMCIMFVFQMITLIALQNHKRFIVDIDNFVRKDIRNDLIDIYAHVKSDNKQQDIIIDLLKTQNADNVGYKCDVIDIKNMLEYLVTQIKRSNGKTTSPLNTLSQAKKSLTTDQEIGVSKDCDSKVGKVKQRKPAKVKSVTVGKNKD